MKRRLHRDRGRSARIFPLSAIALLPMLSSALGDNGTPCAQSHAIVGRCFVVHGRMFFPNGNPPVRISRIGTKRILGVLDGAKRDDTDGMLPEDLRRRLGPEWDKYEVTGDFDVCPLTPERPGRMQFVCLKDASHVLLQPR